MCHLVAEYGAASYKQTSAQTMGTFAIIHSKGIYRELPANRWKTTCTMHPVVIWLLALEQDIIGQPILEAFLIIRLE